MVPPRRGSGGRGYAANCSGAWLPATIARMIRMPVTPGDVCHHMVQLHVHLHERLLHVLNV